MNSILKNRGHLAPEKFGTGPQLSGGCVPPRREAWRRGQAAGRWGKSREPPEATTSRDPTGPRGAEDGGTGELGAGRGTAPVSGGVRAPGAGPTAPCLLPKRTLSSLQVATGS